MRRMMSVESLLPESIMQRRHLIQSAAALAVSSLAQQASAQAFPNKPIKLLIAFPAGGPTDITMRSLADNASKILGQAVIVENKPGAGGTLPAQQLQGVAADGYTLAQIPLGVFRLPYTTKINWDPIKDISYVLNVTGYALGLVQNSPFGIGAPRGTPPEVVKRLHDAFKKAMEEASYTTVLARYDMVPMYMSSSGYTKFAQDTFIREKALVEKLGLAKPS
jgi:tripartite-type tricarboxylate transporter receptor subunit TctC